MAEVTNELLLEVMKSVQGDLSALKDGQRDIRNELQAIRQHQNATQADIANIYERIGGVELRLEHIEKRLNIVAEPAQ